MTNSDNNVRLEGLLADASRASDTVELEARTRLVVAEYRSRRSDWCVPAHFSRWIVGLVQSLQSIAGAIILNDWEAYQLGLRWLDERFASGGGGPGSDMALAALSQGDVDVVDRIEDAVVAGFVAEVRRRRSSRLVMKACGAHWERRVALTRVLQCRLGSWLPDGLAAVEAKSLAAELESLVDLATQSNVPSECSNR